MEVLACELDAFDTPVAAFQGVGNRVRARHPERVDRVFEPLPVQGSELGRAEILRGDQVPLARRSGSGLGEPFPFGE